MSYFFKIVVVGRCMRGWVKGKELCVSPVDRSDTSSEAVKEGVTSSVSVDRGSYDYVSSGDFDNSSVSG